jgi:hypothetical protein
VYNHILLTAAARQSPSMWNRSKYLAGLNEAAASGFPLTAEVLRLDWGVVDPALVGYGCWAIPTLQRSQVS